ncbi:unnamed protein product, partial [Prorocentrum cordatum]
MESPAAAAADAIIRLYAMPADSPGAQFRSTIHWARVGCRQARILVSESIVPTLPRTAADNFYWGGLLTDCGKPVEQHVDPWDQWGNTFERIYTGPGLDGKQWLGVLGNHDYGGFHFTGGWDQAIAYTWGGFAASTNRWMTPAQHWSAKVVYPDFTVDYFFVDRRSSASRGGSR